MDRRSVGTDTGEDLTKCRRMSTTPYTIGIGLKEPRMRSARFCWGRGLLLLLLAVQLCVSWLRAEGGTAFTVDGNSQHTQVSPREQPWLSNLRASNNYDKCKFLAEGPLKGDWPSIPGFPGVVRSFPRWRQASLRRNAARVSQRVRSPSEFIFVSRDEGDERARAAEAPAGSGDTDEENGAEEDEEEFVPPTSDDLGPASEELAEALDKACSPSTEKELLESLGDAVSGAWHAFSLAGRSRGTRELKSRMAFFSGGRRHQRRRRLDEFFAWFCRSTRERLHVAGGLLAREEQPP